MPRYHFNVVDGRSLSDDAGTELADLAAVRRMALRHAGEILNDQAHRPGDGEDWYMEVTDTRGLVLFRLDFYMTEVSVLRGAGIVNRAML